MSRHRVLSIAAATAIGLPAWGLAGTAMAVQPADTTKPTVTSLAVTPNPTGSATAFTLTAHAHDTQPGKVASASYSIDGGAAVAMENASHDTKFQNKDEDISAVIETAGLAPGNHSICVTAIDDSGNESVAGTCITETVSSSTDTDAPTATIAQAAGQADPTGASPINFTVVFSEAVTGFTGSDVTLSGTAGATTAVVTGSGTTYNVAVSGMTGDGTVIADVPAGAAQDGASNASLAAVAGDNTVTYQLPVGPPVDNPPVVTDVVANPASIVEGTASITLTAHASDDPPGKIASASYTVDGVPAGAMDNDSPDGMFNNKDEDVAATVATAGLGVGPHQLCVTAVDDADQSSTAVCTPLTVTAAPDTTAPTVTINQAAGQADPTSDLPIRFSVVFSEDVTGFDASDLSVSAPAGAVATVGDAGDSDPKTYTVSVAGLTADGDVTVSIPAGAAQDGAANASAASTSTDNTVTYDDLDEFAVAASRHTVNQGESVTMSATMVDAAGHTVDVTAETVFTSDYASDVIAGDLVTFPHASPHTITGTYVGGDTDSDVVEVVPQEVAGVVTPPAGGNNGTEGGQDTSGDGVVGGAFLPGTGATGNPIGLGLIGLGLAAAGGTIVRTVRRRK
jgi:hypothetical protein